MLKFLRFCLALSLSWGLGLPALAAAYVVVDSAGTATRFERPPERIVSLLPSLAETVCALGACQKLVGVDRYSVWPPELAKVKKVGGGLDPHIEAVVALKPDVVLVSHSSRASGRLRALGLKVLVMEPKTHADVRATTAMLAQMLGLPPSAAQRLWQRTEAEIAAARARLNAQQQAQKVYFEVSRGPFAAGQNSFMGETMAQLGLGNIVGADLGPFPKLNPEFVVRQRPDVIMAGERSAADIRSYPGWAALPAMRQGRVCIFNEAQMDIMIHPGPRMGEGAALMAQCVLGELPKPKL